MESCPEKKIKSPTLIFIQFNMETGKGMAAGKWNEWKGELIKMPVLIRNVLLKMRKMNIANVNISVLTSYHENQFRRINKWNGNHLKTDNNKNINNTR